MGKIGKKRGKIGKKMGKIGKKMGKIGKKRGKIGKKRGKKDQKSTKSPNLYTIENKKLNYRKKFGGVYTKKITRYVKDYKKVDHLPLLQKVGFYPHIGKQVFKHFKNL